MAATSPFRPSFGTNPPALVGRDQVIAAIGDALNSGPGHPGRATLYTGARGVGKTVLLNEAEAQARERGWVVASDTASRGLVSRLVGEGLPHIARLLELPPSSVGCAACPSRWVWARWTWMCRRRIASPLVCAVRSMRSPTISPRVEPD